MDHYKTLELGKNASKEEIKQAFRRSALKFHPDKHSQSTKEVRDGASLRFKLVSEAYEVLIDDRKRADYDLRRQGRSFDGWTCRPSSSSSSAYGDRRYGYGYGGGGGGGSGSGSGFHEPPPRGGSSYRRPPPRGGGFGFDMGFVFQFLMRRGVLINVAFASVLLGGAVVMERSVGEIWKMNNSGKSFEEAMESIEKVKSQKEKS